jgi:hypothetical protein
LRRAQEKKDKTIAKDLKGLLGASKKAFKKTWEPSIVKVTGQKLHDTIKENHLMNSRIPYCGTQPWQCKHNQKIAFAKLKAKRAWREQHIPMPYFPEPLVLPWFHGIQMQFLSRMVQTPEIQQRSCNPDYQPIGAPTSSV